MNSCVKGESTLKIRPSKPTGPRPPRPDGSPVSPEKGERGWRELFSGELQEIGVHLTPARIEATVEGAKTVGTGLRGAWEDLKDTISKVLSLDDRISPEFREKMVKTTLQVARGLGYTAAGVQGVAGVRKLVKGFKEKNLGLRIDGIFDLTTAAAVATTIAGLAAGPLVLAPLAAGAGMWRGGHNASRGFKQGDGRREIQGGLDFVRSASVGLRLMGRHTPALGVVGQILGPIAGAIQASRGFYDLTTGLEQADKSKQVQGLSDIAAATGLTMAMTGIGTIPGIALAAVAMGGRVAYQFSDRFQGWADRKLDAWEPGLHKATSKVNSVVDPLIAQVRPWVEKTFGHRRGEQASKDPDPPPDL